MNDDTFEWAIEADDFENLDDIDTDVGASEAVRRPLKARQKLEIYWERKRLEENLYDVFADDRFVSENSFLQTNFERNAVTVHTNI